MSNPPTGLFLVPLIVVLLFDMKGRCDSRLFAFYCYLEAHFFWKGIGEQKALHFGALFLYF